MKESETVELKTSTSELKEAIISIVAILNKHQKGEAYFGIDKDGEIVGQTVTENTIREISQTISGNIEPKIFPQMNKVILEGKSCAGKFGGIGGERFGEGSEKSSEKILVLIKDNKSISARQMAEIIGISQRAVEKQLALLKGKGIIKRVGGAKGGHWEL